MDGLYPASPLVPKVVVDRYRKRIKEEDINRGTANYSKAAGAGALAGLVARFKKTTAGRRAAIGAGAGLLAEGLVRAAGRATKDSYGERSHTAKVSEKLPAAAGIAVAGGLAYKRIKRAAREFQNARAVTHFSIPASLRRKLVTAAALAGGITVADAATRASFTTGDRKKAATKGAKEGAVYGGVLAGVEPVLSSGLRKITRKLSDRRIIFEFRALVPSTHAASRKADNDEDLARQRRKLALLAGGALAGAAGLAILARGGSKSAGSVAAAVKPAGRGTLDRLAAANKLRAERGYTFMKPMTPGQRNRFDKLPAQTQVNAGKVSRLATNPQLSPGEHQKMRQWLGRIRTTNKFQAARRLVEFSSFVKDVAFKNLPARARADIRAFHPAMKANTRLAHYGMTTKELAPKADQHNLAAARRNVGSVSKKACADEVYQQRGKKFVLINNDQIVDGHHYLAKAERGRVTASLHVIDLTPARFQTALERRDRAVNFGLSRELLPDVREHVPDLVLKARKIISERKQGGHTALERRLKNAHYFISADGGAMPQNDLPEWVTIRRKNQKHREHLHTAAQVAGVAGGVATVAAAAHSILARKKAVKSLKDYLAGVGLNDGRILTHFRRREQLREGGKSEAEKGSGRFVDPISVAAGLRPAYSISPGGDKRFYGGAGGGDLAITHAQVLRSAITHGGAIRKGVHRAGNLLRDTADVAVGNPRRTDAYGRPQRREWEKPWFNRTVKDVAIGGALLGGALALKKNPKLRGRVMTAGANIRRKVNQMVPDLLANWGPGVKVTNFTSVPFKFGGKIDYARQNALYDWAKQLRRAIRRKAGLSIRPPIAGSISAKPSSKIVGFDEIANYAGWDVRDPRGRSARVFAPGSRKRERREKTTLEKISVQRRLLGALAAVGTAAGVGGGFLLGRKIYSPKSPPTIRKVITAVTPKHPFGGGHVPV